MGVDGTGIELVRTYWMGAPCTRGRCCHFEESCSGINASYGRIGRLSHCTFGTWVARNVEGCPGGGWKGPGPVLIFLRPGAK